MTGLVTAAELTGGTIKPHGQLVLVRSYLTVFIRPAYRAGSLPAAFRGLTSWET